MDCRSPLGLSLSAPLGYEYQPNWCVTQAYYYYSLQKDSMVGKIGPSKTHARVCKHANHRVVVFARVRPNMPKFCPQVWVFFRDPFSLFLGHHAMGLDVHNECKIEFQRHSSSRDSFLLFSLGRISFKPEPYRTWVAGSI
jgi:hypothetical protein